MMVIQALEPRHLDSVIGAHLASWSNEELSVRLGETFVEGFYRLAFADPSTLCLGAWQPDSSEPCCWCLGFRRYDDFNRRLRKALGFRLVGLVVRKVLSGSLPLGQVLAHIAGPPIHRKATCPDVHLGAFGQIDKGFEGVLALCGLVAHTAQELHKTSPACWAVTDVRNRGSKMVLGRADFKAIDSLTQHSREVAVYERKADPPHDALRADLCPSSALTAISDS